jgi:serine/threonine protein kinase
MGILKIQSSLKILSSNKLSLNLFEKIGIIGSGGFSIVWKAKCNKISHLFAIKQISKTKVKKQDYLDLILNEKNIMKDLYFPFISNLYCTFQDESNLYFVIDYFSGGDLR